MNSKILVIVVVFIIFGTSSLYFFFLSVTPFSMCIIPEGIDPAVVSQRCVFLVGIVDEWWGKQRRKTS